MCYFMNFSVEGKQIFDKSRCFLKNLIPINSNILDVVYKDRVHIEINFRKKLILSDNFDGDTYYVNRYKNCCRLTKYNMKIPDYCYSFPRRFYIKLYTENKSTYSKLMLLLP